nr:hypothetical protein [uncultured Cellulosilyticum sp.]
MALGALFLVFAGMSILAIIGTVLLFWVKNKNAVDVIMVLMTAYSLVIAYLGASGEPTNFVMQQIMHWIIGLVAIIGTGLRFTTNKQSIISKVLVAISVLAGIYTTFLM